MFMTDAGYADSLDLCANTPAQAESLLNNLEQAPRGIGLYLNANKTEFMSFKRVQKYLYFMWLTSKISQPVSIPR